MTIDNLVSIFYPHYYYKPGQNEIIINNENVYADDILKYAKEKYYSRLARMNKDYETIFILGSKHQSFARESADYNEQEILNLLTMTSRFKIIVASEYNINFKNTNNREFIHIDINLSSNGYQLGKFIFNHSKIIHSMI